MQVGFLKSLCKNCGKCAGVCSVGAIIPGEGVHRIDMAKCTRCGDCVNACFYGAIVKYGELMSSEEVFMKVKRDKMFYDSSGGGVTVSGGEPLIYPEFIYELFSNCRDSGINTCIETCGFVPAGSIRRVLPVTDWIYFDIKHMDLVRHKDYTGYTNELILENAKLAAKESAHFLFRFPLVPGINDSDENIRDTAEFMKQIGPNGMDIQIMPYHRAGQTKYDALNLAYETAGIEIMKDAGIEAVKQKFTNYGVNCTIST